MMHINPFMACKRLVLGLFMVFATANVALAQDAELPSAKGPVLVTSIGQNLAAYQVQLMLARTDVAFDYDPLGGVDLLEGKGTVLMAVGASVKGFGAAGITIEDELGRARTLAETARENDQLVIIVHATGKEGRDSLSNRLIEGVAPLADLLLGRQDGNDDGLFSDIAAEHEIPLVTFGNVVNLVATFKELFVE